MKRTIQTLGFGLGTTLVLACGNGAQKPNDTSNSSANASTAVPISNASTSAVTGPSTPTSVSAASSMPPVQSGDPVTPVVTSAAARSANVPNTVSSVAPSAVSSAAAPVSSTNPPTSNFSTCPPKAADVPGTTADWTAKPVVQINDNGGWTWYTDERAIVDAAAGKLVVGSDANGDGAGGKPRDGQVDAVIYDIKTGKKELTVLGKLDPDDHNNPGFLPTGDGKYVAFWAGHNQNCNSYFKTYDGKAWGAEKTFDWKAMNLGCPTPNDKQITYNNMWAMSSEKKLYNFVRSVGTSPNLLVSEDNGVSWKYSGRLTATPLKGYVAGYYKYWGNGVDRVDFFATENHPRDYDTSLYHGYVKGGKTYNSEDIEIDGDVFDKESPEITAFSTVFAAGAKVGEVELNHAWNSDVMRYSDGTIVAIWKARIKTAECPPNDNPGCKPDHRAAYARFNPSTKKWTNTYLGKAGPKLYDDEQDYTGLGAAHPNDPNVIYISTTIDPRDDKTDLKKHEIFQGTTCDEGKTFTWTPITANSKVDNLRPIVPQWDSQNMVLLWFRGTYSTAQHYNAEVVAMFGQ